MKKILVVMLLIASLAWVGASKTASDAPPIPYGVQELKIASDAPPIPYSPTKVKS